MFYSSDIDCLSCEGIMEASITQPLILNKKSRSSRFASWSCDGNKFYDKLLRILYVFMLIAIDFVMFIYSINGKLIEDGVTNPAVLAVFAGIGSFAFVSIILLAFSRDLQNLICALVTMIVIALFYNQFALFDVDNFVETWLDKKASWLTFFCIIPSAWLVGLFAGVIIFFAFRYTFALVFVTLVLSAAGVMGIKNNEFVKQAENEYSEVSSMVEVKDARKDNLTYFMIPKFPSYQFLNSVRDRNFRELRNIMVGFYAVNDFEIYPNAFVKENDTMSNIIDILNQVDYTSTTSQNRGYSEFINDWQLIRGSLDIYGLDENRLYDYLWSNGYKISTYSMPAFNLCLKNNSMNSDRCVLKNYKFMSLYDKTKSLEANVYALLAEWILSFNMNDLKPLSKMLAKTSALRGHKVTVENQRLSLLGAPELFAELNTHLHKDGNGKAYMVYVDLPSDIYVYDEYCRLKPKNQWIALKDNSFASGGIDEKRKAYADQAKCAVGLLQMYVDELHQTNKAYQTDVIIQGVSTIRELAGMTAGRYGNFVKDNLVSLAIRKAKKPRFLINANICLASDFTKTLIRYQDYCYTVDNMNMPTNDMLSLKQNLLNNSVIKGSKISNIAANYKYWYEEFKKRNPVYLEKVKREAQIQMQQEAAAQLKKEKLRQKKEEESKANIFLPSDDLIIEMDDSVTEGEFSDETDDFMPETDTMEGSAEQILPELKEPMAVKEQVTEVKETSPKAEIIPEQPKDKVTVPALPTEETKELPKAKEVLPVATPEIPKIEKVVPIVTPEPQKVENSSEISLDI